MSIGADIAKPWMALAMRPSLVWALRLAHVTFFGNAFFKERFVFFI
jgi:hypothetical protein